MKEYEPIDFMIVGANYCDPSIVRSVKERDLIELKPEPENPFDPYAIMVLKDGVKIGYVPNRGLTCSNCNSQVTKGDKMCKYCDASWEYFVSGGLAYRLYIAKSLSHNFQAIVRTVEFPEDKSPVIHARLHVSEGLPS